jgi:hypothetical protein
MTSSSRPAHHHQNDGWRHCLSVSSVFTAPRRSGVSCADPAKYDQGHWRRRKQLPFGDVPVHCVCHAAAPSDADGATASSLAPVPKVVQRGDAVLIEASRNLLNRPSSRRRYPIRRRAKVNFRRARADPFLRYEKLVHAELRLKQRLLSDVPLRPGNGSSETTETFLYISAPKAVAERLRAFIFDRLSTPCPKLDSTASRHTKRCSRRSVSCGSGMRAFKTRISDYSLNRSRQCRAPL